MSKGKRLRAGGRRARPVDHVGVELIDPVPMLHGREVMTPHGLCLGVEIEHGDGHVECGNGVLCPGGDHYVGITMSCGVARRMDRYEIRHGCEECAATGE